VTLDVSVLVRTGMHIWTGNPGVSLTQTQFLAHGDTANVSKLCCGVHTGTHVDAPRHFIDGAGGVETLDVDALCGPALVVDLRHLETSIEAASLATLDLSGVTRVVFATRNSQLWAAETFTLDFVSIAPSAAEFLVDRGIRLVGIDYLSVGSPETHRVLLSAGVICVEGLDMIGIEAGLYDIYCGPVKLDGADGAPARVLLRHSPAMRHDPPDQEMTADPSAVSATKAPV
jgi:arylformamidase